MVKIPPVLGIVIVAGALCCGCSTSTNRKNRPSRSENKAFPGKNEKAAVSSSPWQQTLGRVSLVNPDMGFVLVDIGTAPAPEPGAALRSFSGEAVSGDLVVSTYQRRPFLIGDIVAGAPKVGDSIVLFTQRPLSDSKTEVKPALPESKAAFKEPGTFRRFSPEPLPQDDLKVEFLPNLIREEPKNAASQPAERNISKAPEGPAAGSVLGSTGEAPASSNALVEPSKPDFNGEPRRQAAEIIPGIPVIRKR